jgi:hypothetical protein
MARVADNALSLAIYIFKDIFNITIFSRQTF